ncbi:FkbM family methyltransferase [Mesorhizobium sp. CAU 1732]|uniref:FkbM family methyltransferase n=1 Tax=Mesorhizobium sp. CAU 1732 TaxID=3140358 RepID=UPI0032603893
MSLKLRAEPERGAGSLIEGAAGVNLALTGRLLYPSDDRVLRFLREGWFEYRELAMMSRLVRPGDCFVDIGAHCGLYSRLVSRRLGGNGTIIAVEPNPALHPFLQANLGVQDVLSTQGLTAGSVHLVGAAVAAESGEALLHTGEAGWTAYSSLQPTAGMQFTHAVSVATRPLESLVVATQPGGQIIVKLDTEGLEYEILRQAVPFLESRNDIHLMIEFDENNQALGGHTTADLRELLLDAGFDLAMFDPESGMLVEHHSENALWGANLVATKAIDLLNERLGSVPGDVAQETDDFLQCGAVARAIYKRSEQLYPALRAIADATGTMAGIAAALEGRNTPQALPDESDVSAEMQASLVANMQDQLARLDGSVDSVTQQLDAARETTATLNYGLAQIADRLADHAHVTAAARAELNGEDGQALPAVGSGSDTADVKAVLGISDRLGSEIGKLASTARWLARDSSASHRDHDEIDAAIARAVALLSEDAVAMAHTVASLTGNTDRVADVEKAVTTVKALPSAEQLKAVADLAVDQGGVLTGVAQWLSTHEKTSDVMNPEIEAAIARSTALLSELTLAVARVASNLSASPELLGKTEQAIADARALPHVDQLTTLVDLASDETGKLTTAAVWLHEHATNLRTDIDRHQSAIDAFGQLHAETIKAEKALRTARLDLAALIAREADRTAAQRKLTAPDPFALEHSIKTALTSAAAHLSYGRRLLGTTAPVAIPGGSDDLSSELGRLGTVNRELLAEIHRIGLIADKAKRSQWLRLGNRLGADVTRQVDAIVTLIADIERRAASSSEQPEAQA